MATEDLRSLTNMTLMLQSGENEILRLKKHIDGLEARLASHTTGRALDNVSSPTCPTPQLAGPALPTSGLPVQTDRNPLYDLEPLQSFSSSFRTQYSGPSSSFAILKQLQELPAFAQKVATYFPATEARRADKLKCGCFMPSPLDKPHEKPDILGLLPDRLTADSLVTLYVDTFETTYRVLHVPSFMGHYKKLWQDETSVTSEFLIVLLLAMATVLSMSGRCESSFHGLSSAARETALIWIRTAESWLHAQNREKDSLTTFQVQVLIFIARGTNCVDLRRQWVESGYLVRRAMAAGLNRDTTSLRPKVSAFQAEMRRRLWATILELELLTAMDRGMAGSVTENDWDCQPPSNINDEDFDETSHQLPRSHSPQAFTRTSYLCLASRHVGLRLHSLARINALKPSLQLEDVLRCDTQLRQQIDELPDWWTNSEAQLAHTLIRMDMKKFLLVLHQPFAARTDCRWKYFYSRIARRHAANGILEDCNRLPQRLSLFLAFTGDAGLQAALSICCDLVVNGPEARFTYIKTEPAQLVERNLEQAAERIMLLGQGVNSYWNVSVGLGLAYSKLYPDQPADVFAQQAAAKVIKVHDRIVVLQKPGGHNGIASHAYNGAHAGSDLGHPTATDANSTESVGNFDFGKEFNIGDIWCLDTIFGSEWVA